MARYSYDNNEIIIHPKYDSGYKRYDLSMKDVVEAINKSQYQLNGKNIMIDNDGEILDLVEYIKKYGGSGGSGEGGKPDSNKSYRLEVYSSNGNVIDGPEFKSVLSAVLYENNKDVTSKINKKYFKWTRISGATTSSQQEDAEWNLKWSDGAKEIPITKEDVKRRATFNVSFVTEDTNEVEWMVNAYSRYVNIMNKRR